MRYLIILFSLFSGFASAASYSWNLDTGGSYPSPSQACQAFVDSQSSNPRAKYSYVGVTVSGSTARCLYTTTATGSTTPTDQSRAITRSGDSCASGTNYNSATGVCETADKCKALSGQEVSVARTGTAPDSFATIVKGPKGPGTVAYPSSSCMNSCSITTSAMRCVFNTEGKYRCRGKGTYNGEACAAGSQNSMESGDSTSVPTPQVNESEKNCVFAADTTGKKVCTTEKITNKEGQKCGTFNGEKLCVDSDPTSVKDKTETGVATITKPDGSTIETRTDTNTTTKCEGAGDGKTNCISTSTSTTTTTNKDSGGNTTSTDKKCEGDKCNEKEGGSTGGGSSGGSGSGDGEEEGGSPTTKEIKKPDSGNFEGEGDKWDKKIADAKDELRESWEKIKGNFAPISKIELSGGSGGLYCGPPVTVFEHKIDMCLTKYEGQLSWIAMAVMLICTIVALSIIFW